MNAEPSKPLSISDDIAGLIRQANIPIKKKRGPRGRQIAPTSIYWGVSTSHHGTYRVQVVIRGKHYNIRGFKTELEAAQYYDELVKATDPGKHHLNFQDSSKPNTTCPNCYHTFFNQNVKT
jgi:hypothetical protein